MISDNRIIEEAIRMVQEGASVTFPVRGRSMLPFIVGERDRLILQKPEHICVGQIVLAFTDGADGLCAENRTNQYVIHRIVAMEGERVTLMGDGNLAAREFCSLNGIKAVATHVVRCRRKKKKTQSLNSVFFKFSGKLWVLLCPIRKWLLAIYRILRKVHIL